MSDKIYVGTRAASLKIGQEYKPFSRVTMWYDDEHCYTAGDDTGRTLEVDNPYATQEMVNNALEHVRGHVYRPFEATGVDIDPAFEMGDAININGFYSMIAQTTERLDGMGTVDISAPSAGELSSEFPVVGPVTRELKRRVKLGQKYQGVSIDRRDGLTIVETDGETDGAKVVLNSKKLAFYDAAGQEQLYFDPAAGCYKFRGALNVNDMFIVDKKGNVTIKEGSISWGAVTGTEEIDERIQNAQSTASGAASSASSAASDVLKLARGTFTKGTFINGTTVSAPQIIGGKIYGTEIYAGKGIDSFAAMSEDGLQVFVADVGEPKVRIGVDPYGTTPSIQLGAGDGQGRNIFYLTKSSTFAQIFYQSASGQNAGFSFHGDGAISIIGELEGVHAQFA